MPSRRRSLLLAVLLLLGAGSLVVLLRPSRDEAPATTTAHSSDPGGAGEPLTLEGIPGRPAAAPARPGPTHPTSASSTGGAPPARVPPARARTTLRGRLLDPDGKPPDMALVTVVPLDVPDPIHVSGWVRADKQGAFAMDCASTARVRLVVTTLVSPPQPFERVVTPGVVNELGELRLVGGATLEGRVLIGGQPSPWGPVELVVVSLETAASGGMGLDGSRAVGPSLQGEPITITARTTTDAQGGWRLRGLSPGRYRVHLLGVDGALLHPSVLQASTREVSAPCAGIDIDLAACRLRAQPRGPLGPLDAGLVLEVQAELAEPLLVTQGRAPRDFGLPGVQESGREVIAPAGTTLDVRLSVPGYVPWRERVPLPRSGETLDLRPTLLAAAMGHLRVRTAEGVPVTDPRLRYRLHETDTSSAVASGLVHIREGAAEPVEAPAGTWDVLLWLEHAPHEGPASFLLPARTTVTIPEGGEGEATWSPTQGARLRLTVEAEAPSVVRCELLGDGQPPEPLWFTEAFDIGLHPSVTPVPTALRSGVRMEALRVLPAGPLAVRLTAAEHAPLDTTLRLEAGQVHEATLHLRRR